MLALRADLPGRALPIWKVTVDERHRLRDVVLHWARMHDLLDRGACDLPLGVRVSGGAGGPDLDFNHSINSLAPLLPIQYGQKSVFISWPGSERMGASCGHGALKSNTGKARLNKLRISTRYANVDYATSGFHKSSTKQAKLDAGEYQDTNGKFCQGSFIDAMRTPSAPRSSSSSSPPPGKEPLVSRVLHVLAEGLANKELFRTVLRGPASLVANWEATCERFEKTKKSERNLTYPVFIPSHGRAERSNLNWGASHVFGPCPPGREGKLQPVVCVVVEPREEAEYRKAWRLALMLVLPENGRGPGFARWVVQQTCTKAIVWVGGKARTRRLPWVWIADDGLSMFYRLSRLAPGAPPGRGGLGMGSRSGAQRLKQRLAPAGKPMFWAALLAVQRHNLLPRVAVAGFLRDDGTAVCKKLEWKVDELSLYKIVLLNLGRLRRLGVQYQQDLQMYEDICLNHEVLRNGGSTLKCQSFCFRASHVRSGGCAEQRVQGRSGSGTQMDDLIAPCAFKKLPTKRQEAVKELLQWVQSKEQMFGKPGDDGHPAPARSSESAITKSEGATARADKGASTKRKKGKSVEIARKRARRLAEGCDQASLSSSSSSSSSVSSSSSSSSSSAEES